MLWLALYIAAVFCVALPVAWLSRNEVAAAVFAVWGVGQVGYELGAPEPATQVVLYGGALAYLLVQRARGKLNVPDGSLWATAMFAPLLLVCCLWQHGGVTRDEAWWPIWILAMIQAGLLIRPIVWPRAAHRWLIHKSAASRGGNLMVRA